MIAKAQIPPEKDNRENSMKECPKCFKKFDVSWAACLNCGGPLISLASDYKDELSIENLIRIFEEDFKKLFLPNDRFYENWSPTNERLDLMAQEIFDWLNIQDRAVPAQYTKQIEAPGVYVCQDIKAAIFISEKYKNDPFKVGAILAHECMHHYMRLHNLEATNRQKNELKTDLATICSGLGILIINGMAYKSQWYITVIAIFFGRLYINEQRRYFGYYEPQEFCRNFATYLKLKSLQGYPIIGAIHPQARSFLPREISKNKALIKSNAIRFQEKQHAKNLVAQLIVAAIGVGFALSLYYASTKESHRQTQQITVEFQTAKQQISGLEGKLKADQEALEKMKKDLDYYESVNDTANYGKILIPYEDLKKQSEKDYKKYQLAIKIYNYKIDALKEGRT